MTRSGSPALGSAEREGSEMLRISAGAWQCTAKVLENDTDSAEPCCRPRVAPARYGMGGEGYGSIDRLC